MEKLTKEIFHMEENKLIKIDTFYKMNARRKILTSGRIFSIVEKGASQIKHRVILAETISEDGYPQGAALIDFNGVVIATSDEFLEDEVLAGFEDEFDVYLISSDRYELEGYYTKGEEEIHINTNPNIPDEY